MECFIDSKQRFCYIPIDKNAITKIKPLLLEYGWRVENYSNIDQNFKNKLIHIVILRDPFERLKSQLFTLCHNSFTSEELQKYSESGHILDFCDLFLFCIKQNFSKYFKLQADYVNSLGTNNILYFWLNPLFGYQFNKWFQSENEFIPFNNLVVNQRDSNNIMVKYIEEFLFDYKNHKFKNNIMNYLQKDYDLINSADFFVKK